MNFSLIETIKYIDSRFFYGSLKKLNLMFWKYIGWKSIINCLQKIYEREINTNYNTSIDMRFNRKTPDLLGKLFDNYKSSKGYLLDKKILLGECYNDIYSLLFRLHRDKVKLLVECGIGSKNPKMPYHMAGCHYSIPGGSLRSWRDYFPNSEIIGIDIDPDVIFTEERISTYLCDQNSVTSINNFITKAKLQPNTVDIIVDDGMHEFNANITLFENTKHLLTENGIYIIEDFFIINKEQRKFIEYFHNLNGYNTRFFKVETRYLIIITKQE